MKRIGVLLIASALALPAFGATKTVTLGVKGWSCGSCAASTRSALEKLDGVERVKTDLEKMETIVTYDDSKVTPEGMVLATEKIGYSATIKAVVEGAPAPTARPGGRTEKDGAEATPPVEDVSFFEVPLKCGAAADLGCGSQAKPILRTLEQDARVATAKINHPGTLLAVAWKDPGQAPSGIQFVQSTFEKNDLEAASLYGSAREKALREYKTRGPASGKHKRVTG